MKSYIVKIRKDKNRTKKLNHVSIQRSTINKYSTIKEFIHYKRAMMNMHFGK